jgi:hypothetical protein
MGKIKAFEGQRKRAVDILQSARKRRTEGYRELPVAYLLIVGAVTILVIACLWISSL